MIEIFLKSSTPLKSSTDPLCLSNALDIKDKFNALGIYSYSIEDSFELFNDIIVTNMGKVRADIPYIYENLMPSNSFINRVTDTGTLSLHKLFFSDESE